MIFGAPRILHSDNRKEFVARIIKDLITLYPKTMIINGRPRHPQSGIGREGERHFGDETFGLAGK